jgi:uncharacterized membrane protein YczE
MQSIKRTYFMIGLMVIVAAIYFTCENAVGSNPPPRLRGGRINDEWFCYL